MSNRSSVSCISHAAITRRSTSKQTMLAGMQQQPNLALGLAANMGYPELALLSGLSAGFNIPAAAAAAQHGQFGDDHGHDKQMDLDERQGASRGRTRSGDSRSSSAYASRHQAAEQRRRTRINERWASFTCLDCGSSAIEQHHGVLVTPCLLLVA